VLNRALSIGFVARSERPMRAQRAQQRIDVIYFLRHTTAVLDLDLLAFRCSLEPLPSRLPEQTDPPMHRYPFALAALANCD
jgi:hypothetical protein